METSENEAKKLMVDSILRSIIEVSGSILVMKAVELRKVRGLTTQESEIDNSTHVLILKVAFDTYTTVCVEHR